MMGGADGESGVLEIDANRSAWLFDGESKDKELNRGEFVRR
jgi:hypothetical protein